MKQIEQTYQLEVSGEKLTLLPELAIYWAFQKMLIISDVHIGKAGHFRKHGVALPELVNQKNLDTIDKLISESEVEKVLFLGDLFHSQKNQEWKQFETWRDTHHDIEFILVMGNHEYYPIGEYEKMNLVCAEHYISDPFIFIHNEEDIRSKTDHFIISGHLHPAVKIKAKARQSIVLPCFYFKDKGAIMPAFGTLTGKRAIKYGKNDLVFTSVDNQILKIQ